MVQATFIDFRPRVSIVIPVYNEAEVLEEQLRKILNGVRTVTEAFEIIVVENGSTDDSKRILEGCARAEPAIKGVFFGKRDYGGAMREGMMRASGKIVHVCQIDYFDREFFRKSIEMVGQGASLVIGTRNKAGYDRRPMQRRILTIGLNRLLRLVFKFKGTDTHGLKTFLRESLMGHVQKCRMTRGQFDSELTLRAQYAGISIAEVPVMAFELRPKRTTYWVKIYGNVKDLVAMKRMFMAEAKEKALRRQRGECEGEECKRLAAP